MNTHDGCPIPKLCLEHRKLELEIQDERGQKILRFTFIAATLLFILFSVGSSAFATIVQRELGMTRQYVSIRGDLEP